MTLGQAVPQTDMTMQRRRCERQACDEKPVATLTFVYADSTAVLGPLAVNEEPYAYDLCGKHAVRLKAPRGWEVIRLSPETQPWHHSEEEMDAIANKVRERGRLQANESAAPQWPISSGARYGHLRALPSINQD